MYVFPTYREYRYYNSDINRLKYMFIFPTEKKLRLLIIGNGPESERLLELTKIEELESYIKFLGEKSTKEVIDCIKISDVVVGTSLKSNLNLYIQEAMACNKAVLVFDSGEIRKLITDMINGILIPTNDLENFSEKLQYIYENPELVKMLGENARKTIIEQRSWEIRIKKELIIYEEIFSRISK
jgi:L-malate glycosyltransferase